MTLGEAQQAMSTRIRVIVPTELENLLPALVESLRDTVNGGAPLGFLPPLTLEEARNYWLSLRTELESRLPTAPSGLHRGRRRWLRPAGVSVVAQRPAPSGAAEAVRRYGAEGIRRRSITHGRTARDGAAAWPFAAFPQYAARRPRGGLLQGAGVPGGRRASGMDYWSSRRTVRPCDPL
jgi:hypothetical protein